MIIKALKGNKHRGYVKHIDFNNGELTITENKSNALVYNSDDSVQSDIDFLSKYYHDGGYIFLYE